MQAIGNYYLINRGAFNVDAEVVYTTNSGQTYTTDSYGKKMAGQSITFDPGSNGNVQNGYTIKLKAAVQAGKDKTADESFEYESGNPNTANYAISRTTLFNTLKFLGVTDSVAASEELAAEFTASDADVA